LYKQLKQGCIKNDYKQFLDLTAKEKVEDEMKLVYDKAIRFGCIQQNVTYQQFKKKNYKMYVELYRKGHIK